MVQIRYTQPKYTLDITSKKGAKLLRYIFNNALTNISTRDKYEKIDRDAMEFIDRELKDLNY